MILDIDIKALPAQLDDTPYIEKMVLSKVKYKGDRIKGIVLVKRSIDARGKQPLYFMRYKVYIDELPPGIEDYMPPTISNDRAKTCIIVGAGPAGYFAGLECLALGIIPIIVDRGKDVRLRRRDLKAIQQSGIVNPHSNYCFGEGGAGTYSDGKLYTRSQKRGSIEKVLQLLVAHGANPDILVDAHPHIGSNKLPIIVSAIRDTIIDKGGQVLFDHHITDFNVTEGSIKGVVTADGKQLKGDAVILATGHSARDIYQLLFDKGITIEAKPFAMGVRIEHPQPFIDKVQYGQLEREDNLPASSYSLACQVEGLGVFSFCMCPGGLIVPAATSPGELVVNGMSLSRRDSPYANSGLVTAIELDELATLGYKGIFAAVDFQRDAEVRMFEAGDGSQKAPAQRALDFVEGRLSPVLNETSYIPGLLSCRMDQILPANVSDRLKKGLVMLDKKMKGYLSNDANIIGIESRTSAPIRIPRDNITLMHKDIIGLFPCGEGAGYAGGILSAAMDGQNCAQAVARFLE